MLLFYLHRILATLLQGDFKGNFKEDIKEDIKRDIKGDIINIIKRVFKGLFIPVVGSWHRTVGSSWSSPWGPWGWDTRTWPRPQWLHIHNVGQPPQSACGCSSHCGSPDTSSGSILTPRETPGTCPGPRQSTRSSSGTNSYFSSHSLTVLFIFHTVLKVYFSLAVLFFGQRFSQVTSIVSNMRPGLLVKVAAAGGAVVCRVIWRQVSATSHCSAPHSGLSQTDPSDSLSPW